jgi:hypothetical protein
LQSLFLLKKEHAWRKQCSGKDNCGAILGSDYQLRDIFLPLGEGGGRGKGAALPLPHSFLPPPLSSPPRPRNFSKEINLGICFKPLYINNSDTSCMKVESVSKIQESVSKILESVSKIQELIELLW